MYVLNCFTEASALCCPLYWDECPNLSGVRGLRLCPSQWRGGLVYKGTDKGSFDDVTSSILRRHQKNLCLSLLTIYGPSSSSATSSSLSASSQKEVCFSTACKRSRLVCQSAVGRNGFFLFWRVISAMWHWMKMPNCDTVWFSGKIITFKPPRATSAAASEGVVKSDELLQGHHEALLQ